MYFYMFYSLKCLAYEECLQILSHKSLEIVATVGYNCSRPSFYSLMGIGFIVSELIELSWVGNAINYQEFFLG